MNADGRLHDFLDHLNVGISMMTWHPEDTSLVDWVFVNEVLCGMLGKSRAEILGTSPYDQLSREARSQIEAFNEQLIAHGQFSAESIVLDKSHQPIPVMMHMQLIKRDEGDLLLTEFQDIRSFKEIEVRLNQAGDRARNIMMLISREKRQISNNIQGNLGLVVLPLIDQLRMTATDDQQAILDILVNRVRHVSRRLAVSGESGLSDSRLTRRQILICEMIRDGMTSKDIARALECSPSTINNHRDTIRRKLGLSGKTANLQAFLNSVPGAPEDPESGSMDTVLDGLV